MNSHLPWWIIVSTNEDLTQMKNVMEVALFSKLEHFNVYKNLARPSAPLLTFILLFSGELLSVSPLKRYRKAFRMDFTGA